MKVGSLFSGIGGFDLGFERSGMEIVWQVEIDEFCNKVLAKHWPNVKRYGDIKNVTNLEPVDLVCGGFPCQDISFAGTGLGLEGSRSSLWVEYDRIIGELKPRYVVVENSPGLLVRGLARVLSDLSKNGYDAEWQTIQAAEVGAPHKRERLYIVAYSNSEHGKERMGSIKNRKGKIFPLCMPERFPIWLQAANRFIGMDDGLPPPLYANRGKALGNAVVPQIVEVIGRAIMEIENEDQGSRA